MSEAEIKGKSKIENLTVVKLSTTDFVIPSQKETLKLTVTVLSDKPQDVTVTCNSFFCEVKNTVHSTRLETTMFQQAIKPNGSKTFEIGMRDFMNLKILDLSNACEFKPLGNPLGKLKVTCEEYSECYDRPYALPIEHFEKELKLSFEPEKFSEGKKKYEELVKLWEKKEEERKEHWRKEEQKKAEIEWKKQNKKKCCCSIL